MKIKTFQFLLSNHHGNDVYDNHPSDYGKKIAANKNYPYSTEKQIDKKINRWIEKNNAIIRDIKIVTYTVHRHNNGGDDAVIAIYTITYDLPAGAEVKEEA